MPEPMARELSRVFNPANPSEARTIRKPMRPYPFPPMRRLLLALTAPLFAATPIDLFTAGASAVHTYRIPALVETRRHVLIAIADARHDSARDLPAHITLVMRRSLNLGKTWTPPVTIQSPPEGGVGDAALLADRDTGRVWCFFSYGPPGIGFATAQPGAVTGPQTFQFHAIYSDNDGATWSAPTDLTPQVKDPAWPAMFAASGTDIQLHSGRYLVPLVVRDPAGVHHAVNAYSDDHGQTWHRGAFIGDGTDESHNVELPRGVVLQNMRATQGNLRLTARSTDGGITFGPVTSDPSLPDPECNASIARYHRGKSDLLLFTNAAGTKREKLTLKVSPDQGQTWSPHQVLTPGPAAYSVVIALHDGTIAILYENGAKTSYERITFVRLPYRNW